MAANGLTLEQLRLDPVFTTRSVSFAYPTTPGNIFGKYGDEKLKVKQMISTVVKTYPCSRLTKKN